MLCVLVLFADTLLAQGAKARVDSNLLPKTYAHHREEYDFDVTTNEKAWASQPPGLQASFGSTDELYFRKEVPLENKLNQQQLIAWRGERINLQILVWSVDTVVQVRIETKDLVGEKGTKISASNATVIWSVTCYRIILSGLVMLSVETHLIQTVT